MKFEPIFSRIALNDLEDIWDYTARAWSVQQANKYYNEIIETVERICLNPSIGRSIQEVKKGHLRMNTKAHMIIYKTNAKNVHIDRILHQRMDIDKHLGQ